MGRLYVFHCVTAHFIRIEKLSATLSEIRFEGFVGLYILFGTQQPILGMRRLVMVLLLLYGYIAIVNISFAGLSCDLIRAIEFSFLYVLGLVYC